MPLLRNARSPLQAGLLRPVLLCVAALAPTLATATTPTVGAPATNTTATTAGAGRADDTPAPPPWRLGARVEADEEGGYALAADLAYRFTPATRVAVSLDTAEYGGSGPAYSTTGYAVDLRHDFGPVAVRGGVGGWRDPDVLTAEQLYAELEIPGEAFALTLSAAYRESEFEPIAANATVQLRGGRTVVVRATANCSLEDVGYGARLRYDAAAWGAYAGVRVHDYRDTACTFSAPGLDALARARAGEFRQFAARATNALALGAGSRIGVENALLDRSLAVGAYVQPGRVGYAVDLASTRDHYTRERTASGSLSLLYAASEAVDLEFTLGATDAEAYGTTAYAGFGMQTRF